MKPPTIPQLLLARLGIPEDTGRIVRWYANELRHRPRETLRSMATDITDELRERLK